MSEKVWIMMIKGKNVEARRGRRGGVSLGAKRKRGKREGMAVC
jgi:DNA-binding IscR family transcriptional regulator